MNTVIAIIAAFSFYLLPLLIGRAIFRLTKKGKNSIWVDCFTLGGLALFSLTAILYLTLNVLAGSSTTASVMPWFWRFLAFLVLVVNIPDAKSLPGFFKTNGLRLLGMTLVAGVVYGLWRWGTYYPLPLNWDFFHHQTLVNQITSGHFSFIPSHLSDTFEFNGYSTLFHVLMGIPEWIFSPDILTYFWWLEFFHLLSTLIVSYYLAKAVTKSELGGWIMVILSGFVFESFMAYGSLMLIPQTLMAMVFAGVAAKFFEKGSLSIKDDWQNFVFVIPLHYVIGIVAFFSLSILGVVGRWENRLQNKKWPYIVLAALLAAIIVIPWLKLPIDLNSINNGEGAAFNLSLAEKIDYLKIFSGYLLFILTPVGLILALLQNKYYLKLFILVTGVLIFAVFCPVPYAFKFYVLARYFINVLVVMGLLYLFNKLTPVLRAVALMILVVVLTPVFISSSSFDKSILRTADLSAQISPSELEAANFLKNNYAGKEAFLVSDPATQHILEPLSGVNTQGGAYANKQTRTILSGINLNDNPAEIKAKLSLIKDADIPDQPKIVLLALSGRYFIWQSSPEARKMNISFNIWAPAELNLANREQIMNLAQKGGFKIVFQNSSIVILETIASN
jgi:hypothetical protein